MSPWIEHFAVVVCAISGVLAAEGREMDLFGALVLALVTAVGGGTIRDLCLDVPVFWVKNPIHVRTALIAASATFVLVRFVRMPQRVLMIADAFGLALFGVAGTEKALNLGSPSFVAIMMGVITGVAGGILRDVLRREVPWVFQREVELYATAVFFGALALVVLREWFPASEAHRYIAMGVILVIRFAAMRWKLRLPDYKSRDSV
jgi:uncharacterized membrane protein YeiH